MSTTDTTVSTKVITRKVRFSYLHVFEPVAIDEGSDKKYSAALIIPKTDTATLAEINAAIEAAKEQGKNTKFAGKIPAKLKSPLRDGDIDRPEDENYANSYFVNANAKTKPGILDKDGKELMDQSELYSGCYGRASITFYAFDTKGNKGIACGLNNLQKLKDGPPLGGRASAEADFANVPIIDEEDDDLM